MGWPYSLVDANWNLIGDDSIGAARGPRREEGESISCSGTTREGPTTSSPRSLATAWTRRSGARAEFARLQKLGVKGVKVDFFDADKQFMIQRYLGILEDAADHEIMVVFHG